MVYRGLYSYQQRVRVVTLFFHIFFVFFCMLSVFANCFLKESPTLKVAHLHNAGRAVSSPSRCFQLSTNLGKDLFNFVTFDIVAKNKSNVV